MSLIRINRHPSGRQLVLFGLGWLALLGCAGRSAWLRGSVTTAEVCWGLAALLPALGLGYRPAIRTAYLGLSYVTYPIGFVLSHVILAVVYYLVLTPIGLVLRLFRHDPLARRFDPNLPSYWSRRPAPPPPESYFRQS